MTMMMTGRLFGRRLRPQRLAWTLMLAMVLMFVLASANEVRKKRNGNTVSLIAAAP